MGRFIAITDIHGELRKLESVLSKIDVRQDDTFVFLGDYIDRGPDSKGVVEKVIEISEQYKTITLIGSHEYALLHADKDDYYHYLFWNYGGPATVKSYGGRFENILATHGNFYRNLKFYHLTDDYLFVHAGIDPRYSLEEQCETDLVYIRSAFYNRPHNLSQKIIFGHTEFDAPLVQDDKICIDLGCGKYKNAKLCALILDNRREEFVYSD